MVRFLFLFLIVAVSLIQEGCGEGGSSVGVGNTVTLNAGATPKKGTLVESSIASSASRSTVEELSFDVTSTANINDGSAQNVTNFQEIISFEYQGSSDPNYAVNATLPTITQNSTTSLTPGSTWTQNIGVGTPQIKEYVLANYVSAFQSLPTNVLRYKVTVTFIGIEATGKTISTSATGGLWIINQ